MRLFRNSKKSYFKKTGARGLRSILENILLKTMFELPDMENVVKVTVDGSAVKNSSEPIVTYGKKSSASINLHLFLEISLLITILVVNESILFKTPLTS